MLPPRRPTLPAASPQGAQAMSVQMPPQGGPHSAPQGPPGGGLPDPAEGLVAMLGEIQALGVEIQPGPAGTLILSGIPPEILAQVGGAAPDAGQG